MAINNTTYRVYVEKLGDVDPSTFVGNEGEVFYDPDAGSPTLRLSDGSTAGGIAIGGGGGSIAGIDTTGTSFFNNLNVTGVGTFSGFQVNTIEGTGEAGVTRLLLQASNNGDAYLRIPTNSVSSTENVIIGNELRGIQLVGGVVLESDVLSPVSTGGTVGSPTSIPLTLGYAVLNVGAGGNGWFDLPDGQEGQIIHLLVGITTAGTADDVSITIANARYTESVEGNVQAVTGPIVWNPFGLGTTPVSMATLLFAQGNWNVGIGGTITPD